MSNFFSISVMLFFGAILLLIADAILFFHLKKIKKSIIEDLKTVTEDPELFFDFYAK